MKGVEFQVMSHSDLEFAARYFLATLSWVQFGGRHKFKDAWVRRFCRRWNISLRKKSNAKCKSVFERLHQVKNYDWWLIYKFQNPDNFDGPYFSFEEFVEKEVLDTEQDKELGSEEDPLEPSEETNSSSED